MEWALAKACKEISSDGFDDDNNIRMVIDIMMKIRFINLIILKEQLTINDILLSILLHRINNKFFINLIII